MSQGFICPRGRAALEYFRHPRRLQKPLKRVGPRGEGRWIELPWEEAIGDIAARIKIIRGESGPEAVALLSGTFHGPDLNFGYRLMHGFGSPNSGGAGLVCGGPQYAAAALTFGLAPLVPDLVPGATEVIVIWGQHPAASRPIFWGKIREAVRRGAKLFVVDPRPTQEARQAHSWLSPRPGTDAALALGLLHILLKEGLIDREFCERWTVGLDELERRLEKYPPRHVESVTSVPAEKLAALARAYGRAHRAVISSGSPNGMGRNALNFERALMILVAITGHYDEPGSSRAVGPLSNARQRLAYEGYESLPEDIRGRRIGSDQYKLHGQGFEMLRQAAKRVWGETATYSVQQLGLAHPLSLFRAMVEGKPYQVRALITQYANLVGAYPNAALVRDALMSSKLELHVIHEISHTPTTMLADYVLPACTWLEKSHLAASGLDEPIISGQQVTVPRGEAKSDYDFCRDLGRALGQDWPGRVEDVWDLWLKDHGVSFAELSNRETDWWLPNPAGRQRHETIDADGKPRGFGTPSGRVEISSSILTALEHDPLPDHLSDSPASDLPLFLMTGATRIDATHQDHRQIASLRRRHPDPIVEVAPETALSRGIQERDWVVISNARGQILQRATIVRDMPADRVNAERWWYPEQTAALPSLFDVSRSNVNFLTSDALKECDDVFGALPFRIARCDLRKASEVEVAVGRDGFLDEAP